MMRRDWLERLKIGWILSGDRRVAGARLQGFLMHEVMLQAGVDSTILHSPPAFDLSIPHLPEYADELAGNGYQCVIFQKVTEGGSVRLAHALRARGIRTVFISCNLFGQPMIDACDATIAASHFLKRTYGYKRRHKITVIEDPIEIAPSTHKKDYRSAEASLRLVYVASEPPSNYLVDLVTRYSPATEFVEISGPHRPAVNNDPDLCQVKPVSETTKLLEIFRHHDWQDLPWKFYFKAMRWYEERRIRSTSGGLRVHPRHIDWSLDQVQDQIISADIAVIPCELNYEWNLAKSGNRLTMMMALGMPVIVSPLPAYKTIMRLTGTERWLIARSHRAWGRALVRLQDERLRRIIGERNRAFAQAHYSANSVARAYLDVFCRTSDAMKS